MVDALPKGWPPLGPKAHAQRLSEGYALLPHELEQLKLDADRAAQLENEDPAFARAARLHRHVQAEEAHVEEMRLKLQVKAHATEQKRQRMQHDRIEHRKQRERARERGKHTRQEVVRERDRQRQKLVERIALAERRTLVRETIQKALLSQSRTDGHAERIMFTHPSKLGDNPGPGAYDAPPQAPKGTSFAVHPSVELRKLEDPRPGPGAYDPGNRPNARGGPSISFGGLLSNSKRQMAEKEALPGPGAHHYTLPASKGGTISKHVVKSDMDYALDRAAAQPGPGSYEPQGLTKGKSSTMTGRTRGTADIQIASVSRAPGPGAYDLPGGRVRGGVMTVIREFPGDKLPAIAPGPGSYMQTPTISQEREMRKLSKQVVDLVKGRQAQQAASAPEAGGNRRGGRGGRSSTLTQEGLESAYS